MLDERGMPRVHGGAAAAPGLFFVGYTVSLRGMLRDIAADARRVAPAVARDYEARGRAILRALVLKVSPAVGTEVDGAGENTVRSR